MDQLLPISAEALFIARICIAAFLAILFLQSGSDKLFNFKENLSWLSGHFKDTFFSGLVPVLFVVLTLTELSAGLLSAYGIVEIIIHRSDTIAFYGASFAVISLLFLFAGQRLAKDYNGASSLVAYFIAAILAVLLLG